MVHFLMVNSCNFLCMLACATDFGFTNLILWENFQSFSALKIGPLGLSTLIFISNLLHCAVCFQLPKCFHKMIWSSLKVPLDIIILWKTLSSLLENPSVCIYCCASKRKLYSRKLTRWIFLDLIHLYFDKICSLASSL